jgi:hypothetical protein
VADDEKRAQFRAQYPELAELVDTLRRMGCSPAMINISDHDGNLIAGRELKPTPPHLFEIDSTTVDSLRELDRYNSSRSASEKNKGMR